MPPTRARPAETEQKNPPTCGDATAPAVISEQGQDAGDLAAALEGDHEAFGRLYDRHAAVVMSLCRRLAPADAEDALQETFFRAHRKLDAVHDPSGLRSWLYAIARRVCSERVRSARRRRYHEEAMAMNTARVEPSAPRTASESADHAEQLRLLDAALDELDDRERLAIHLHYLESDPVQAARDALGISRSGYYKLLGRARNRLAELMK